jgi:hypothetical protein
MSWCRPQRSRVTKLEIFDENLGSVDNSVYKSVLIDVTFDDSLKFTDTPLRALEKMRADSPQGHHHHAGHWRALRL